MNDNKEDKELRRPTADQLNTHLANGLAVQVTTYTRSIVYTQKHTGYFREQGQDLQVKAGRGWNTLAHGNMLLVGIRVGRLVG